MLTYRYILYGRISVTENKIAAIKPPQCSWLLISVSVCTKLFHFLVRAVQHATGISFRGSQKKPCHTCQVYLFWGQTTGT